jgi:hypothetical protein
MPAKPYVIRLYAGIPTQLATHEDLKEAAALTSAYFTGATVYAAYGVWERKIEASMVVEIVTSGQGKEELARALALDLKARFNQESVLMTVSDLASHELIS